MLGTADLLDALRRFSLLEAEKLDELERKLQGRTLEARALADKLVESNWLTAYQAERLLDGRGSDLVLGPYVVLDRLGKGGMGEVVKARHRILARIDAIKTIRNDSFQSEALVQRFQREARAAAHLRHPNVVQVYSADKAGEVHYLAMEYVAGTDLSQLVHRQGPLPIPMACEYVRQAALGLQHIHAAGLVHRDIKPSNLLLQSAGPGLPGVVKVLDLGLARFEVGAASDGAGRLTASGVVIGTPDFLAPEQTVDAHTVDRRADLYSLGCTLYCLLAGAVPFPGGTLINKVVAHQTQEPEPLEMQRPATPREVVAIVRKLMAKQPEDRFQTAAALVEALSRIGQPQQQPPPVPAWVGDVAKATATGHETVPQQPPPVPAWVADAAIEVQPIRSPKPAVGPSQPPPGGRSPWRMVLVVALMLALGLGGLAFVLVQGPRATTSSSTSTPLASPTQTRPIVLPPSTRAQPPTQQAIKELPKVLEIELGRGVKLEMVRIDPGEFWMGSREGEGNADERPRHKVHITRQFYLGKYEVTQEQYERVTRKPNPSSFCATGSGKDKVAGLDTRLFPVENITWQEAEAFCDELAKQAEGQIPAELRRRGYKFHLPTEAQWEYACRAGTQTAYHFGDKLTSDRANCGGLPPIGTQEKITYLGRTCKVGHYQPNDWKLYDMHGNVREWCQDVRRSAADSWACVPPCARTNYSLYSIPFTFSTEARPLLAASWLVPYNRPRAAVPQSWLFLESPACSAPPNSSMRSAASPCSNRRSSMIWSANFRAGHSGPVRSRTN
jgi:formylglycine-generating enzyme required for sulfatase activity/tRNA A-37 threonylcarbamoyl transferase component Bud32